jgi:multidrug efflux pump subunit AcrA (membrane-fusion protein)
VQAKALVKQAKLNLERTVISAQFTGRLQATNAELGTVINQNILLAEGFSAQDGEIRLPISINDLPFVSGVLTPNRYRDMAIELSNPLTRPAETWQATLERVEAQIDQQSQQAFIVARINNAFLASENDQKNPLQLGQYLKAKLMGDMLEDAIVLPNNLIYQGSYVYLVERSDKSRLKRQAVTVLYRGETESVIASGLEVGQEVVTTALGQLTSGTLITIQAPSAEVNTP